MKLSLTEIERANGALNEMRSYISAVHPGSDHPVWDALDTVRAALAQQAQPEMPTEAMVLEALANLNYDDLGRVGDIVPRESMPAIANAIMALFNKSA